MAEQKLFLHQLTQILQNQNYSLTENIIRALFKPETLAELGKTPTEMLNLLSDFDKASVSDIIDKFQQPIQDELVEELLRTGSPAAKTNLIRKAWGTNSISSKFVIELAKQEEEVQLVLINELSFFPPDLQLEVGKILSNGSENVKNALINQIGLGGFNDKLASKLAIKFLNDEENLQIALCNKYHVLLEPALSSIGLQLSKKSEAVQIAMVKHIRYIKRPTRDEIGLRFANGSEALQVGLAKELHSFSLMTQVDIGLKLADGSKQAQQALLNILPSLDLQAKRQIGEKLQNTLTRSKSKSMRHQQAKQQLEKILSQPQPLTTKALANAVRQLTETMAP